MIRLDKDSQQYIMVVPRQCPRPRAVMKQFLKRLEESFTQMLYHGMPIIYTDFDFRPNETQLINKQVNDSHAAYLTRIKHMNNYTMTSLMGNRIPEKSK